MSIASFLLSLKAKGIGLSLSGDNLKVLDPHQALTSDLLEEIKLNKKTLIQYISGDDGFGRNAVLPQGEVNNHQEVFDVMYQQEKEFLRYLLIGDFAFNMSFVQHIENLDKTVFENVVREICQRHEILRTTFFDDEGIVKQRIHPYTPELNPVTYVNLSRKTINSRRVRKVLNDFIGTKFSFEARPLMRISVVDLALNASAVMVVIHHNISDKQSLSILQRDMMAIYEAFLNNQPNPLPAPPVQFRDYCQWVNSFLAGEKGEQAKSFYTTSILESLSGGSDKVGSGKKVRKDQRYRYKLTREVKRMVKKQGVEFDPQRAFGKLVNLFPDRGASFEGLLVNERFEKIKALSAASNVTLFTAVITVYAILLSSILGRRHVRLCVPFSTRVLPEFQTIFGWMTSEIILCVEIDASKTFAELAGMVRDRLTETAAHRLYPCEKILDDLDLPLNDVVDACINLMESDSKIDEFEPRHSKRGSGHFNFSITVRLLQNALYLRTDYRKKGFNAEGIEQLFNAFLLFVDTTPAPAATSNQEPVQSFHA